MTLDLERASAEVFAASVDGTVGLEEEFAILDPEHARPRPALRGAARRAGAEDPLLADAIAGELISSRDRDPLRPRGGPRATRSPASARRRRRLFAPRRAPRRRARRDRHAPVGRLPRAAEHRHRALPPRRRGPAVRRAAQQHLLAARPRRRRATSTARCASATGCARCCRCCWRSSANSPFLDGRDSRPALRAHADLHAHLPALRHPRRLRLVGRLPRLRRLPRAHELDRRVHAGLVVGPPALRLRHGRGAHLRRPGDGGRERGARGADRRLRRCRPRATSTRACPFRDPPAAPGRGEPLARDPLRPGRQPDRPRHRGRGSRGAVVERLPAGPRRSRAEHGIELALPERNGAQRQRAR